MVYLDHAATTPLRKEALEAMMPFFMDKAANASALYAAGRQARGAIDTARRQVAQAVGSHEREIYFTAGGSEADNWALFGIARAMKEKRHIITTKIEHHAVLNSCAALEQTGYPVTYIEPDEFGFILPEKVRLAMRPDTGLVSVMTANNEVGTIEPIAEIAAIAHENGALMHTDAVQAVGHIPIDVKGLGVDLLSMAAHKFYGPKGIGALYIRSGVHIANFIYGGEQEKGLRAGTENTPAIVGMGRALELVCGDMGKESARIERLRDSFEESILSRIPSAHINGMRGNRLPGTLHVTFLGADTNMLLMLLDMEGIAASAGSACAAGAMERSHVIRAMNVPEGADVRFSLGMENTQEDIRKTVDALCRILN